MTSKIRQELMEEMRKEADRMQLELRQEFLSQEVYAKPVEALVSLAPKSTKGSCVTPTTSREDIIGQTSQFELLVEGDMLPQVVAIGKVSQQATTSHNVPLSPDVVKVTVEKVRVPDARVPLPLDEVTTVANAFHTFIAWPIYLIRIMPEPPVIISFHYINLYLNTYNLIQMFFIL